jgi:hypothetical protein
MTERDELKKAAIEVINAFSSWRGKTIKQEEALAELARAVTLNKGTDAEINKLRGGLKPFAWAWSQAVDQVTPDGLGPFRQDIAPHTKPEDYKQAAILLAEGNGQ